MHLVLPVGPGFPVTGLFPQVFLQVIQLKSHGLSLPGKLLILLCPSGLGRCQILPGVPGKIRQKLLHRRRAGQPFHLFPPFQFLPLQPDHEPGPAFEKQDPVKEEYRQDTPGQQPVFRCCRPIDHIEENRQGNQPVDRCLEPPDVPLGFVDGFQAAFQSLQTGRIHAFQEMGFNPESIFSQGKFMDQRQSRFMEQPVIGFRKFPLPFGQSAGVFVMFTDFPGKIPFSP